MLQKTNSSGWLIDMFSHTRSYVFSITDAFIFEFRVTSAQSVTCIILTGLPTLVFVQGFKILKEKKKRFKYAFGLF